MALLLLLVVRVLLLLLLLLLLVLLVLVVAALLLLLLVRSVSISFLFYKFSLFAVVAVIYSVLWPLAQSKMEKTNGN